MKRFPSIAVGSCLACILHAALAMPATGQQPWPQFRGPGGDGIAIGQNTPVKFSETENVTWKSALPGRGWSSPVIAENVIWLTTAIERTPEENLREALMRKSGVEENALNQRQIAKAIDLKLIAVDLRGGSILETIDLDVVEEPDAIHTVNSYASPTPVIDGDRIYCHFGTFGTFCVDRKSHQLVWKRRLPLEHGVGPGSSPVVYQNLLVLVQDGMDRQYVAALDKRTGETAWETDRPPMDAPTGDQKKSYCTPIAITDSHGREQLICMSSQWMVAYDPETGSEIWKVYHGKGFSVVPRPVYADDVVYFATGFGKPQLWAVRVDGKGDVTDTHVEWTVLRGIPARPSPVLHNGLIYVVDDSGVASCFDTADGHQLWKKRLGGTFSASPLLAGGYLYFANHDGDVTVIEPGSDGEIVAENHLDGQIMASPAAVDDALIFRTDQALYRIES